MKTDYMEDILEAMCSKLKTKSFLLCSLALHLVYNGILKLFANPKCYSSF